VPAVSADDVMLQAPAAAVTDPTGVASLYNVTVEPVSAVPLNVGVVSDVRLSVELEPKSDAASRSGVDGVVGAVVSIVTERVAEPEDSGPVVPLAVARTEYVPAANAGDTVHVHVVAAAVRPEQVAIRFPGMVEVLYNLISTVFVSLVPVNVGVVSVVILSVLDEPVSDDTSRSGVDGLPAVAAKADTDKLETKTMERITNRNTFDEVKLCKYSGMIILFIIIAQ
jgi:hypothetical protein